MSDPRKAVTRVKGGYTVEIPNWDLETLALNVCVRALNRLGLVGRLRVLRYLRDRFEEA